MKNEHNSSSHIQKKAEEWIFERVQERLNIQLANNLRVTLANNGSTYIQPDFYSEDQGVVGEIFAHIGRPKKAQDNKIANDILKMLLLEKIRERQYRKIIVVCDEAENEKLHGKSALAESIRRFGIEIMYVKVDGTMRKEILQAQERQKMTNME